MVFRSERSESKHTKTLRLPLLLVFMVILSGCLFRHHTSEVTYINGSAVESLSSSVSLSYDSAARNISGSGLFMFRKPDHMRMVVLSPFGSVLQEVYVSGELVTILDNGNGVAFSGSYKNLPASGDFSGWRYIHWVLDIDPPDPAQRTEVIERVNRSGELETATFEKGMLISKTTATGGCVRYGNYTAVNGAAFPLEIVYETAAREKYTIVLEDPEVNIPFAEGAFAPDLAKWRVYPLSVLK